jgi:tetratricopeptide (TPR) repeat protein
MQKSIILFIITLCYYCLNINTYAQSNKDSLEQIWKNKLLPDSIRLKALSDISGNIYLFTNPDTAFLYADSLHSYAEKVKDKKQIANALNIKGISYVVRGNYYFAVDFFNESLKISEEIKDDNGIANTTNSLGIIYQKQADYKQSLNYFTKCLEIREAMKDTLGMANSLANIGIAHSNLGNKEEALIAYLRSVDFRKQIGDKAGLANSYANIGNFYNDDKKHDLALEAYLNSLELYKQQKNTFGQSALYLNIARLYLMIKNLDLSLAYADSAFVLAEKAKIYQLMAQGHDLRYKLYKEKGDFEKSLRNYELAVQIKDSLDSDEHQKLLLQKQFEYEYEKKEAITLVERKRQKTILFFISSVAFAIALIALLVYRSLRNTKKQKQIIEKQKIVLEEKQKEIFDSMHYAKRIQQALLTSEAYIEKHLKRLISK